MQRMWLHVHCLSESNSKCPMAAYHHLPCPCCAGWTQSVSAMLCCAGSSTRALPCSTRPRHTSLIWRSRCLSLIRWAPWPPLQLSLRSVADQLGSSVDTASQPAGTAAALSAASAHTGLLGCTGTCLLLRPPCQPQMVWTRPHLAPCLCHTLAAICGCHACGTCRSRSQC